MTSGMNEANTDFTRHTSRPPPTKPVQPSDATPPAEAAGCELPTHWGHWSKPGWGDVWVDSGSPPTWAIIDAGNHHRVLGTRHAMEDLPRGDWHQAQPASDARVADRIINQPCEVCWTNSLVPVPAEDPDAQALKDGSGFVRCDYCWLRDQLTSAIAERGDAIKNFDLACGLAAELRTQRDAEIKASEQAESQRSAIQAIVTSVMSMPVHNRDDHDTAECPWCRIAGLLVFSEDALSASPPPILTELSNLREQLTSARTALAKIHPGGVGTLAECIEDAGRRLELQRAQPTTGANP